MNSEIYYREATTQADIDAVVLLFSNVFHSLTLTATESGHDPIENWLKIIRLEKAGFTDLQAGKVKIAVALDENKIIGATLVEVSSYGENHGDLHAIAVSEGYCNNGIGTSILEYTKLVCAQAGLWAICVNTASTKKYFGAPEFWKKHATRIGRPVKGYFGPIANSPEDYAGLFYIIHLV